MIKSHNKRSICGPNTNNFTIIWPLKWHWTYTDMHIGRVATSHHFEKLCQVIFKSHINGQVSVCIHTTLSLLNLWHWPFIFLHGYLVSTMSDCVNSCAKIFQNPIVNCQIMTRIEANIQLFDLWTVIVTLTYDIGHEMVACCDIVS